MNDLIEALQILAKYTDAEYPTGCEHDLLHVYAPREVSETDRARLEELSFEYDADTESWISYRFGSA